MLQLTFTNSSLDAKTLNYWQENADLNYVIASISNSAAKAFLSGNTICIQTNP